MKPITANEYYHKGSIDILSSVIESLQSEDMVSVNLTNNEIITMLSEIRVNIEAKIAIQKKP